MLTALHVLSKLMQQSYDVGFTIFALQMRHLRPRGFREGVQIFQLVSGGSPNTCTESLHPVASEDSNFVE